MCFNFTLFIPLVISLQFECTVYLNSNYIKDMVVDEDYIYLAATRGAVRFDTNDTTFTKYTNVDGLIDNCLTAVALDSAKNVYFLHERAGLTILSPDGNFSKKFVSQLGLGEDSLLSILVYKNDLFIGTNKRLWYNNHIFISATSGLIDDCVRTIKANNDTVWFGTNRGVSKVFLDDIDDTTKWQSYTTGNGLPSDTIEDIDFSTSYVWVATTNGVGRFDGGEWKILNTGLPSNSVNCIAAFNDTVYAGTDNGVGKLSGEIWTVINDGLLNKKINALVFDSSGTLWAGTEGKGIAKFDSVWKHYISDGPHSNFVDDIMVDPDGSIWCTHFGPFNPENRMDALSRLYEGEWIIYDQKDFGYIFNIRDGMVDRKGNRWFTCFGYGVLEYTAEDSFVIYNKDNSELKGNNTSFPLVDDSNNRFFSIYVPDCISILHSDDSSWSSISRSNYTYAIWTMALAEPYILWLGSEGHGNVTSVDLSMSFDDHPEDAWDRLVDLDASRTYTIGIDHNNDVWIGTDNGLYIYDGTDYKSYKTHNSDLLSNVVRDIDFDREGNAWIVTEGGLNVVSMNGFWHSYTERDGLSDCFLISLDIDDEKGEVWIGTYYGGVCKLVCPDIPPGDELEDILVYPNPFLSRYNVLTFRKLPKNATVRIFTLNGELIREIKTNIWDGKNQNGDKVSSGVYIYLIQTEDGRTTTGKLAVIR